MGIFLDKNVAVTGYPVTPSQTRNSLTRRSTAVPEHLYVGSSRGVGGRRISARRDTVAARISSIAVLLGSDRVGMVLRVLEVQAESCKVNVAVTPDEQSTKSGLGKNIENTIEDSLAVGADDIAALGQTPGDGVQEPKSDGPDTTEDVGLVNVCAESLGVCATLDNDAVRNKEERNGTEGKETPLVGRLDESTDKTGDDHDLVDEDDVENGRAGQTAGEEQVGQKKRCGDEPVDVADIEDLAHQAADLGVGADKFNLDGSPSQVGSHSEVCNACNHADGGGNVVEDTLTAVLLERETHKGKSCNTHDCADSEVLLKVSHSVHISRQDD
jgi:hypothetical protein